MFKGKFISGDVPANLTKHTDQIFSLSDWRDFAQVAADFQSSESKWMKKRLRYAQRQAEAKAPLSERYKKRKEREGFPTKPLVRTGQSYSEFTNKSNYKTEFKQHYIAVKLSIAVSKAKQMIWLFNAMRRKKTIMNQVTPKIMETLVKKVTK